MKVLRARNVCDLLPLGLDLLAHEGAREDSRAGPVVVYPTPVTSVYEQPTERVLRSARRDANPFFHLFEALWMLAGRNNATSLNRYVRDFGERFAEYDGRIHGAYGSRWRRALGHDQLNVVVDKLQKNPYDRQCVIQMWDARAPGIGSDDLLGDWKDRPCNTHVYLRVRELNTHDRITSSDERVLDLTVLCRSNDIVMGAYGANAVHFSFLQEYLAGRIGVGVGVMYQVSNNYHGYVRDLDRIGDPRAMLEEQDPYATEGWSPSLIGNAWEHWDTDLQEFMLFHEKLWELGGQPFILKSSNAWFQHTAMPLVMANFFRVRGKQDTALSWARRIDSTDWRVACVEWLGRRAERRAA